MLRSLYVDADEYHALPPDQRIRLWAGAAHETDKLFTARAQGKVLLDIGCGPPEARGSVSGIDYAFYIALDYSIDAWPDVVASIDQLCLADDSIDTINCISVLEHVYDTRAVIAEMFRALRPGGCVRVEVPFLLQFHGYPNDFFRYTHVALRRLFEDAGFVVDTLETNWSKGTFLNAAKMLEDGSWSFTRARWRLLARILALLLFRVGNVVDRYHAPGHVGMYHGIVMLATKPDTEQPLTA